MKLPMWFNSRVGSNLLAALVERVTPMNNTPTV